MAQPTKAEDHADVAHKPWGLEEVRLGGLKQNLEGAGQENGLTVNGELVFASLFRPDYNGLAWAFLSASRPHVGVSINTAGKTSQAYLGTTWTWPVAGPLFFEWTFGGTAHNGPLEPHYDIDPTFRATYGCPVNFRESASAGIDISDRWRLLATIDHMSNAGLCGFNRGLTNVGGKLSYRLN